MNENPWHVDNMAQYERERIQREMKQIRLEEQALRAGRGEGLLQKLGRLARRWQVAHQRPAGTPVQPSEFVPGEPAPAVKL